MPIPLLWVLGAAGSGFILGSLSDTSKVLGYGLLIGGGFLVYKELN